MTGAEALTQAVRSKKPVEVTGSTTSTDTLTANPNGTFTLTRAAVPVRKFVAGSWKALDPTLVRGSDGTVGPAVTTSGLRLSAGGSGPLVTLNDGGRSLSLSMPMALPAPVLSGPTATYPDVLPGVDLKVTVGGSGSFKQVLVVRDAAAAANPALSSPRLATQANGLTVTADTAGNLAAVDAQGHARFTAAAPTMWDSAAPAAVPTNRVDAARTDAGRALKSSAVGPGAAARVKPVRVRVSGNAARDGALELTPDASLLKDSTTVYPVFIDPDWTPVGASKSGWATVAKQFAGPYWNNTPDPDGHMQVGYSGDITSRTLINFPIPVAQLAGATINSATFYLTNVYSYSCGARPMYVHVPSATLTPGNATWSAWVNSMGAVAVERSFAHGYTSGCPAASEGFDVRGTIVNDVNAGKTIQTIGLAAKDETDTYGWKEFDPATATLSITYNHPPKTPDGLTTSPTTACSATPPSTVGDGPVSLYASVADAEGGNLGVAFGLWKTSDATQTPIASSDPALLTYPAGSNAVLVVPVATLRTAAANAVTQFSWRVRTTDGLSNSSWSATCTFNFDPTRTGSPIITPPATSTIGKAATFQIARPASGPIPSAYLYQLNGGAPAQVIATSGSAQVTVSPTRMTNTLTITSLSAGSNIGDTASVTFNSAPAGVTVDQDTTGDGVPDLRAVGGNALPAGLWQAVGTKFGVAVNATNIGINGNGVVGDNSPANFAGAQVITGHFTGTGQQDFLVYYPGGANPGGGMVIRGPGDGSALQPQFSGNEHTLSAGMLSDINNLNPLQLVNAGNSSGQGLAYPDLISINGDASNGYYLTYYASQNGINNYQFPMQLSTPTPTGGTDWNNWTISSAQLATGTAMFLWNKTTGALYLWTNLAYDVSFGTLGYTAHTIAVGGWNTGATLTLQAADANLDGSPDLWTFGTSANATLYLLTNPNTSATLTAQGAQTLVVPNHNLSLNDTVSGTVTAHDTAGTATLTGVGHAAWNTGDLYSPDVVLNGTDSALTSPSPLVATNADFAVSVWVKPTGTSGVVVSQDGTSTAAMKVWAEPADASWRFAMSTSDTGAPAWDVAAAQGGSVHAGIWTHLTATYNRTTGAMTLYIDDAVAGAGTHTVAWNAGGNFRVGDTLAASAHTGYLNGQVARLQTWNRVTSGWGTFRELTLADFDGDNKRDLDAVRTIDGSLARWHGSGAGAFNYTGDWGPGWNSYRDFAAADINGDGKSDLTAVRNSDGVLGRWYGDGVGGFNWAGDWGPGWDGYHDFAAADINSDHKADLVAVRNSDGALARWYGDGVGGFNYAGDWGPGWDSYHEFVAADFNGDGAADLVAVKNADGSLARWNGDGAGGFNFVSAGGSGWNSHYGFAAGDINSDGKADLVAVNATDGTLARWNGNGAGGFTNAG